MSELLTEQKKKIFDVASNDLVIKRVPIRTLRWFKEYANQEFSGDYGMCLMFIIKAFRGFIPPDQGVSVLVEELDELRKELNQLRIDTTEKEPVRRMANGRVIKR